MDPSVPASTESIESSRPSRPWPSQSMPPTTLAANDPPGYCRKSCRSAPTSGYLSVMDSAIPGSTARARYTNVSLLRSFFSIAGASGLLFSAAATSRAMSVRRSSGSGADGAFCLASANCFRTLAGWKVSARASVVKASLSKFRSTMAPRTAGSTSVTFNWLAAWARRPSALGTWRLNSWAAASVRAEKITMLPTRER